MAEESSDIIFDVDLDLLQVAGETGALAEWSWDAVKMLIMIGMPYDDSTYTPTSSWRVAEDIGRLFRQHDCDLGAAFRFCEMHAPWASRHVHKWWMGMLLDRYDLVVNPRIKSSDDGTEVPKA